MAKLLHFIVFAAASCPLLAASVSSLPPAVFKVGDERGWTVPSGNGTETYNHWAKRNRFQVGDALNFKYANDSVLLVSHDDYKRCHTGSPLSRFTDGDTKFTFDRYGLYYFVSGIPGHCEAGQRMIVRVMAPSALTGGAPATAPAPAPAMPPTVGGRGESSPVSSPGVPPGSSSGSSSTSTPSPSPLPQASGASRRAISVVSSIVVGFVIVGVISLLVLV